MTSAMLKRGISESLMPAKPELKSSKSNADAPCFFSVVHTFVDDAKAETWWAGVKAMTPEDLAAVAEKYHSLGFHYHNFLPSESTGLINCLWECKGETDLEAFQAFIDGPDSPAGGGVSVNKVYKVLPGAVMPASHFASDAPAAPAAPSSGSFFWVFHTFKAGTAEGFWEMLGDLSPADIEEMGAKQLGLGFHNHTFAPLDPSGPCICLWESRVPMTAEEFGEFMNGPDGPGAGAVFDNVVHKVPEGAVVPSAKFAT